LQNKNSIFVQLIGAPAYPQPIWGCYKNLIQAFEQIFCFYWSDKEIIPLPNNFFKITVPNIPVSYFVTEKWCRTNHVKQLKAHENAQRHRQLSCHGIEPVD
jgi:hypothetical protein